MGKEIITITPWICSNCGRHNTEHEKKCRRCSKSKRYFKRLTEIEQKGVYVNDI